jgi:hypothetical protein
LINTNTDEPETETHLSLHLFQRVSQQGKQTIPYLLVTTLTFYKNIKSVLVLVNHHFLILGGGGRRGNLMSGQNVMISKLNFLILNKYWECYEITEYLKIYSWSKHVKQINEFLMAMRNMWWHFRFLAHRELLSSLFVRHPSVNISHFNLLLRNHWANCNQSLVEWFLDGRQAKNRKRGGWNFNCPLLL